MKKLHFLITCLIIITFTSCQFSENIYINDDGSGRMEFGFDASEMMSMMGDEMTKDGEESIDSIITFKKYFDEKRDSIAQLPVEEQEALKKLEKFSMHMVMNQETKEMKMDMYTDFKNINELGDMFEAMNKAQSLQKNQSENNANPFSSLGGSGKNSKLNYTFNGTTFKRIATVIDKEALKTLKDSLGNSAMMFASSKYKLNYHFPKKIKSVSNEDALFSADGKSVTIEFSFMDYISDPEKLNLEIILED